MSKENKEGNISKSLIRNQIKSLSEGLEKQIKEINKWIEEKNKLVKELDQINLTLKSYDYSTTEYIAKINQLKELVGEKPITVKIDKS